MAFTRKDLHKKKRLNPSWRKPKGLQNKMRLSRKSHNVKVRPGYGTPNAEKHQFKGLDIVHITKIEELETYNPKTEALNIAKISKKNKIELITKAKEKGFTFVNFNADKYLESVKEQQQKKKDAKKIKENKKTSVQPKKTETKKSETTDKTEKSEEEIKQEKDKILTKSK